MEAQAALVGSDRAAELHAEAAVYVDVALIVLPGDAELDDALGLDQALHDALGDIGRLGGHDGIERLQHLAHGLMKFGLRGIAADDAFHQSVQIGILKTHAGSSFK